ncbi:hypothetical protein F5B21DRAFT_260865 [Xylaria acuta]|nr:hypothetical protein F5B21DRAFT_260865 [Xylaria acuta]
MGFSHFDCGVDYLVKPMPISQAAVPPLPSLGPTAVPSISPSLPAVPASKQATPIAPISSFPVAPPPRIQSVVPAVQYAVAAPPVYPTRVPSVVPSAVVEIQHDVESTAVVPIVVPSAAPSYPVKNEYIVKSPPVVSHALTPAVPTPHALPSDVHISHALPSAAPSVPAQHQYAVADRPVYSHAFVPVAPSMPAQNQYAVADAPVFSHVAAPVVSSVPAQHQYTVTDAPAFSHVAAPVSSPVPAQQQYAVADAPVFSHVAAPVSSSLPAQQQYAVADAPVYSHAVAPVASPVPAFAENPLVHASAAAPVQSHAVTSVAPSFPAYSVESPAVHVSSAAAAPHETPSRPVEPVYAVETPVVNYAVPVVTPDPAGPSGKNECVTKCHPECKKGDSQCMAACLQTCHSAKMLGSNGLAGSAGKLLNNKAETHDNGIPATNAKAAGKPVSDAPTLAGGAGFKSFEACMSSCKGKFQQADIAFPISQGKYDCAEACAAYASEGAGIAAKRDVVPVAGALRPAAPALTAGAGYASYEACLEDCHGRWQSANIVFDIAQGRKNCKKACAQYTKDGSGVAVKRAVEPVLGALRPAAPELAAGAGFASYEACLEDCHGRWQSANIVFDVAQGRKNCKTACASYASEGSGVVVKKETAADATPAIKKTTRAFPFEGNGPLDKAPKDGPFTKTPETVAGASTSSYEACMHGCGVKLQSADIAFEVEQGNSECATRCARYSSNGAGVSHV